MYTSTINKNSGDYQQETPSNTVFKWNYISCGMPIVSSLGNSGDGVMATEDKFGMIFPGPNGEWYPASACSIGAFTAAGKTPQVDGDIPATDTAATQAGFDLQMDCETGGADVGLEVVVGGGPMGGNHALTVGTHSGYIDATFQTPDWTDFDCVAIGWRKVEDFDDGHVPILKASSNAADGIYADYAVFGNMGDTNLETVTQLNTGGSNTLTDLGGSVPVDNQNLRIKIHVSSGGVVTYGFVVNAVAGAGALAQPASVAAFTFDDGDVIVPYIATLSDTAAADVLWLKDITVKKYPGTSAFSTQG